MSLLVLCPSRGRPTNARAAYASFLETKSRVDTTMVVVVDDDDPDAPLYKDAFEWNGQWVKLPVLHNLTALAGRGMARALDYQAMSRVTNYDVLGFIGDDHRFRTDSWDTHISNHLASVGGGIAYGNDLFQGENLPTQVFISANVLVATGWYCVPGAVHLYLDDAWKTLGNAADCLYYFPEIIIEHLHPLAGKADWDEGYQRVNDPKLYSSDAVAFEHWKAGRMARDVEAVKAAIRGD